jgi:hypothetical protein
MKNINVDLFRTKVLVTTSEKEFAKVYEEESGQVMPYGNAGLMWNDQSGTMYVGVWVKDDTIDLTNTIVHEFTHCALHIAHRIGLGDIMEEQEAFAYLMAYLVSEFYKLYPDLKVRV